MDDSRLERREQQVTSATELWTICSQQLRVQVPEATWRTWFSALQPAALEDSVLVMSAPNSLIRER
ncbi:MAG: DnaA N-terminal domain-containing protein [Acidimicrobiales bacterium]